MTMPENRPSRLFHFRIFLGWILLGSSLLLLVPIWLAYARHWDRLAVFAVPPVWLWSILAILAACAAWLLVRRRWILLAPPALWCAVVLVLADEAKVLRNGTHELPEAGPAASHEGQPVIRVITMNCATYKFGSPAQDIGIWQPDIVLLQDAYPHQTREICARLYGTQGHMAFQGNTNGIVSRWPIQRNLPHPIARNQQATILLPDKTSIEIVNVHLQSAATDLRLWRRATWTNHRVQRSYRLHEIDGIRAVLHHTTAFPMSPVILGGDFNAPATDVVHQRFADHFKDSFLEGGSGWGNTYHRRFPVLRIDLLYHTFHFTAVRARTVESTHSDHRMLVVDYVRNTL